MKGFHSLVLALTFAALSLTACGSKEASVPTAALTSTPDPCAPENQKGGAIRVHELMRQFDDAYQLASSMPRSQLAPQIAVLQNIRRLAQDQAVPACLVQLKKLQLINMNTVINTLLAFLGGTDQNTVNQGIAAARQQHDAYTVELARLLDVTVVAPPTGAAGTAVPAPAVTQSSPPPPAGLSVTNPGPNPVNLRASAAVNALQVGVLEAGQSAAALGKSPDGQWILIERPGQPGQAVWVYGALVQLSGDPSALPVVTPSPP